MSVDDFFTRLNPVVRVLLETPGLHWILSPGLMLLTVTGRRSRRRFTFPVGYRREGDELVVMASEARKKRWWRNLVEPAEVDVRLRGRAVSGKAQLVDPHSAKFREDAEHMLARVPGLGRTLGIAFDRPSGLTEPQLEHLRAEIAIVRIALATGVR